MPGAVGQQSPRSRELELRVASCETGCARSRCSCGVVSLAAASGVGQRPLPAVWAWGMPSPRLGSGRPGRGSALGEPFGAPPSRPRPECEPERIQFRGTIVEHAQYGAPLPLANQQFVLVSVDGEADLFGHFEIAHVLEAPGERCRCARREKHTSDEHPAGVVPALPTRKQCTLEKAASLLVAPSAAKEESLPDRPHRWGSGDNTPEGAKPHSESPHRCPAKRRAPELCNAFLAEPRKLAKQHAPELGKVGGRILEGGEDRLALGDPERQELRAATVRAVQLVGELRVVDESYGRQTTILALEIFRARDHSRRTGGPPRDLAELRGRLASRAPVAAGGRILSSSAVRSKAQRVLRDEREGADCG
jgi:hypothetical protein